MGRIFLTALNYLKSFPEKKLTDKTCNLSVYEKLSRNLPNQVQQLDLKLLWYMEFRSKSQKQSQNDGTQFQQLEC